MGLNRWPSQQWSINVAWTQIVALAANLLACLRHLALPAGELRDAAPKLLRYRLLHLLARLMGNANDGSTCARTGSGPTT
ncbi:MAG: hypothetical protein ACRDS0_03095 [Pseudonocardiaceae bacterium]